MTAPISAADRRIHSPLKGLRRGMHSINQTSPTVRMIAEKCDVSRSTVSLALKGDPRISSQVIKLVTKTALELGYTPDPKVSQIMSYIARKEKSPKSTIGLLLGSYYSHPNPWRECRWLDYLHKKLIARAEASGYSLDTFWLGEEGMSSRRMREIMIARGIDGLIVLDHFRSSVRCDFDFSAFASVVIGHGLCGTGLDLVGGNLHEDMLRVLSQVEAHGYSSPGLALDACCPEINAQYWTSSYCYFQSRLNERDRVPYCIYKRAGLVALKSWYHQHRPDVIIGLSDSTLPDLERIGVKVPADVGFITLQQGLSLINVSGINSQYDAIAMRAVDLVTEKLRRFEKGVPAAPELVLFNGTWLEGETLPAKCSSISA